MCILQYRYWELDDLLQNWRSLLSRAQRNVSQTENIERENLGSS